MTSDKAEMCISGAIRCEETSRAQSSYGLKQYTIFFNKVAMKINFIFNLHVCNFQKMSESFLARTHHVSCGTNYMENNNKIKAPFTAK